ncbi:MAG: nuclease A inhibitor family protein [Bacteroidota bacterium]
MALITLQDLQQTLQATRTTLLAAANGDGIVSRADLKSLLKQTEDPGERRFLEFFYHFLLRLENRPRMRVTAEVIDRGLVFIQEEIMPNFEVKTNFLSRTNQRITQVHQSALPVAMALIRRTAEEVILSPRAVKEQITPLAEGLFFDDFGSEAGIAIDPFFEEHPSGPLSPDSFTKALGVDPDTPRGMVVRFEPADRTLLTFVEQHAYLGLAERARALVETMQANLDDIKVIVLGLDNHPDLESNHPVYVVGTGQNGNLAGFQSVVIWT